MVQSCSSVNETKVHSTAHRFEPCETNKIWALIPPSLKLISKFLLSGVVEDGAERGSLGLKDDAKAYER